MNRVIDERDRFITVANSNARRAVRDVLFITLVIIIPLMRNAIVYEYTFRLLYTQSTVNAKNKQNKNNNKKILEMNTRPNNENVIIRVAFVLSRRRRKINCINFGSCGFIITPTRCGRNMCLVGVSVFGLVFLLFHIYVVF